jgi:hypothetical protein
MTVPSPSTPNGGERDPPALERQAANRLAERRPRERRVHVHHVERAPVRDPPQHVLPCAAGERKADRDHLARGVFVVAPIEAATSGQPLWNNLRDDHDPFHIVM